MKRTRTLLTLLAAVALALGAALAQSLAPLPDDARFDQPVAFSTGLGGESLQAMLTALARSIDLTPVFDAFPDRTIVYDIGEPKPFRQVWSLVLTLNDLDYVLQDNDVVVIGTSEGLARLRATPDEGVVESEDPRLQRFYRVNNDPATVATILRRAVSGIEVDTLPGTNALVVVGTEAQQEAVEATLLEFDTPAEVVRLEQRTYFLSNARAGELATTLQNTVLIGSSGENGATERLDGFTVVADARTNSLIVTGSAEAQSRLAALIDELDRPQRQVNVQVRIQEVTRSASLSLGIDWNAGFGNLSSQVLSGGLNFIFDTTQVISSLNVLAVLDTLETQGLTRRVDDSNITVVDSGTGRIQSGGTLFITLPGANQNIERTIPYGVQIDVTPRIAADGRITLDVEASVDDLVSTAADPTFQNIASRNVQTTISVAEGQTVLLGGLLQNSLSTNRRQIPVLGSIPLIGDLFARTITEEDNVDLLIILTAQIID